MTIDEMITVLQAAKAGKQIQTKTHSICSAWTDCSAPVWHFRKQDYRVKPEPREWVVEVNRSGNIMGAYDNGRKEYVKVREVL